jgi:plastocyanin domain-containing protein
VKEETTMKKMRTFLALTAFVVIAGGAFVLMTHVAEAHTRTVRITVDNNGFSPSSIDAEAGHKLNLVFKRASGTNCGNRVVFPKLGIRRNLPVGKEVVVSITPRDAGQINFSCGMGMYKGSIVISEG